MKSQPPKTRDRGPKSDEDTQTDFSALDVLRNTIAPATSIDACTSDGFALNNQVRITGSGVLLVGGEAFRWWPWKRNGSGTGSGENVKMEGRLLNAKGQWEVDSESWGVLELVHPKPGWSCPLDLLSSDVLICDGRFTDYWHRPECHAHHTECSQVPE
jgi:NADH dehydrogenase [ubiquinone] 1 alpha subcomplex assembly factor 3